MESKEDMKELGKLLQQRLRSADLRVFGAAERPTARRPDPCNCCGAPDDGLDIAGVCRYCRGESDSEPAE